MTIMTNQNKQGTFPGAKGLKLYYQSWHPPALAKAVLVIVHGHGAHSGIFRGMVKYLLECNYVVYSFDLRGNGRSPGQRGYINNWAEFRADLKAFLDLVTAENADLPLFLMGQSLGGAIALDYALREPNFIQGLILMSPALGLGISNWKIAISKLLSSILPNFALDTGIDFSACSRNPEIIAASAQDSLRHSQGTARLATELLKTIDWINAHAKELQIPLLILHGGADRVTLPKSSCVFFERLNLADKEKHEYPGSYHELHHDLNCQEVLADIKDWIDRHLSC
ncbi:Alpha/beta hydrolase fold protein [Hyella patelloides LEGE 07179]|uniref:Monoacylglycerol lipase n=2 Tax=Hyella TaxID=945733 RepID=A0A563VPJ9_9CYAN|nr:Alpha/beta hydrolase fold protein [Hyella patelloides LEGE 07179]